METIRVISSFEAVVVGSGFGGAVVACRSAQRWPGAVLVLERGKRYPAGSFARTPDEMSSNFWNADGDRKGRKNYRHADQRGLFDVRHFRRMDAVMAAGLGGGSLIYANVILEPPQAVFNDQRWPMSCTEPAMRPYYEVVRKVLGARPLPDASNAERRVPRAEIFADAAVKMGRKSRPLDLAVYFGDDPSAPIVPGRTVTNAHGAEQTSCTYCGECDLGCNTHAKNTLDLNYLFVAEHDHRAVIETQSLVEKIVPLDADGHDDPTADGTHGYRVQYRNLDRTVSTSVVAKRVIVAAGALGSTELLLRCRDIHKTLPSLSPRLGTGFSGNGDFLTFVTGVEKETRPSYGPVITQAIDFNLFDQHDPDRAFILEDAGYPNELAWFVEGAKPAVFKIGAILRAARHALKRTARGRAGGRMGYALRDALGGDVTSNSAVLLCMGLDSATGDLTLDRNGWVTVRWPQRANLALYKAIARAGREFGTAVSAALVATTPTWWLPIRRNITVHALGGCPLGATRAIGVVSSDPIHFGEAFGYHNLFVADGAIVPVSLGSNPSLTIAALAEMVAEGITGQIPTCDLRHRSASDVDHSAIRVRPIEIT